MTTLACTSEVMRSLKECESVIAKAQRLRLQEAKTLRYIRDNRLYRVRHKTFEDYCHRRWGFTRQHASRLCDYAEVGENLSPIGVKTLKESQARQLVSLTPEQQITTWNEVSKAGKITANAIAVVAGRVQRSPAGQLADIPYEPTTARTPLRWFGGKIKLASRINHLLPPHHTYVEVFGGSGAVLFSKKPSPVEIYNDLHGDLVHFFKTLRERKTELHEAVQLTPYSRQEFENAKADPHPPNDVERARKFFVRCRQSYGGVLDDEWSFGVKNNQATSTRNAADKLMEAAERLRRVQIENSDFHQLLKRIPDRDDIVIFADPPYLPETRTRSGDAYDHEMSGDDHLELLGLLTSYKKAKVLISGYRSKMYDEKLNAWKRYDWRVRTNVAKYSGGHRAGMQRVECLWTS